jgi:nucleotide-binding universal stress UspA family protein
VMAAVNRTVHGKITMGDTIGYILKNAPCEVILVRIGQDA